MIVLGILTGLTAILIYFWYSERKRNFEIFKSIGVDGPTPNIIFGNIKQMKEGTHRTWEEWRKRYGKTFGYFEGPKPVLVTSDVELLKHVLISDFYRFTNRKPFALRDEKDKFVDVFTATGQTWKRLRSISSPSFSMKRMKEMSPLLNDTVSQFLECLQMHCKKGEPFDIHGDFQKMTLTAIASCAFGIEVNPMEDPNDIFLERARKAFSSAENNQRSFFVNLIFPIAICFPDVFSKVWHYAKEHVDLPRQWFLDTTKKILEQRMEIKSDRVDFLKLMLDANVEEVQNTGELTMTLDEKEPDVTAQAQARNSLSGEGTKASSKKMTMQEMQAQSMIFLLAGYETSSTALGLVSYALALHPHIQRKLQAEIDENFPDKECTPDYNSIQKLPYLDMVIYEVLRMYPIAQIATTRVASEDCVLAGQTIPKGLIIQAHMEAIHRDPDLWGPEDPDDFVPERFLPERKAGRHAIAWMPFGVGPRNCVGMRFALLEIKLTLVRMLKKYTIEKCDETKEPLPLHKRAIVGPSEGVFVKLVERE